MREKKVLERTIKKYIIFLQQVKEHALPLTDVTLQILVANNSINKSIPIALERLNIIKRTKGDHSWEWLTESEPNKEMALQVLDVLLHLNKPITQPPILPAWATQITDLLKEISSKLTNPQTTDESSAQGFKISDKRFEMAKAIAIGVYSAKKDFESLKNIDERNDYIIEATDNLLLKLNSK